ncbi:hypothetical protein EVAR_70516_1 [Eumeta japonica]|uniref:Uncharacterized protein n=1 Tax=Eumeta variegata TaxID=151549 RepID=A0A4C1T8W3_EUMVA|nr:hypothetical protein EVAR_70516_1 [Eumeta japonica]
MDADTKTPYLNTPPPYVFICSATTTICMGSLVVTGNRLVIGSREWRNFPYKVCKTLILSENASLKEIPINGFTLRANSVIRLQEFSLRCNIIGSATKQPAENSAALVKATTDTITFNTAEEYHQ